MSNKDLKVVLEVEQESANYFDSMFYRYRVGDFKLWFSQDQKDGNIYSVGFAEDGVNLKDFELRISANEEGCDGYYPNQFEIRPRSYGMATGDAREFMKKMKQACDVLDVVESFFGLSKHFSLYAKCHDVPHIKVTAEDRNGRKVCEELYRVTDTRKALEIFNKRHREFADYVHYAAPVGFSKSKEGMPEKVGDEMISRDVLMGEIQSYFGRNWNALDEDCQTAWKVISNYNLQDGDLVSRNGLLDAVLGEFGCDLAYYGRDLQFFQDAIIGIPSVSANRLDDLICNAESQKFGVLEKNSLLQSEKEA